VLRAGYTPASGGLTAIEAALVAGGAARGTLDTVHACSSGARARTPDASHDPPHAGAHAGSAAASGYEAARHAGAHAEPGASDAGRGPAHAAPSPRGVNGAAAPSGGGPAVQGEAVGGERDGLARRPWRRRGQEVSVVRHMVFGCMGLCEMASGGCDCFALLACRACEPGVEPGVRSSFGPCLPGLGVAHWPSIARADRCSALDAQRLVKQD